MVALLHQPVAPAASVASIARDASVASVAPHALAAGVAQVLVAEDDPDLRRLIVRTLQSAGHAVTSAVDGEEALRLALEIRPDLLLLDVSMPVRDGYDVCRAIHEEGAFASVPAVIFLSAHDDIAARVTGLESGAVDYIIKPFAPAELKARVAAALRTKTSRDTLAAQAATDGLTGLANRRQLDARAAEATGLARRHGLALACLMVDVDHFKTVNDTHGHAAGDRVLREVARRIRTASRTTDVPGRYGGEEFAVLLPETDAQGALAAGEKLRAAIASEPIEIDASASIDVRASIGVATWDPTMRDPGDLFARADSALYTAKQRGRNRVVACEVDFDPILTSA